MGQISHWTARWTGRLIVITAAGALCLAAQAAEKRARVKFSDSKDGSSTPDVALPTPLFQGAAMPRVVPGSGANGIAAAPLAPSVGSGSAPRLFQRDPQDPNSRNSWMTDVPDGSSFNEDFANRAFGVRPTDPETPMSAFAKQGGAWSGLRPPTETTAPPPQREPAWSANSRSRDAGIARVRPELDRPGLERDNTLDFSGDRQANPVIFSDSDVRDPLSRNALDSWGNAWNNLARDPARAAAPGSAAKTDPRSVARSEQFRRILGVEPIQPSSQPNAAVSGFDDPLAVQPDPTRREMKPVTAIPSTLSGGLPQTSHADSIGALPARLRGARPSWADSPLAPRPRTPALDTDPTAANPERQTLFNPTVLELPGRAF